MVDDEVVIAQTLTIILNQAGFQASAFNHPNGALAARAELLPDVLISDVAMLGMTGVDLAIHFRLAQPDCRILLFSGQAATASCLEESRSKGFDFELLAKPMHPADLLTKLHSGFEAVAAQV